MKRWTKDEEELLRKLINIGYSYEDLEAELDRTKTAIIGKVHRLQLNPLIRSKGWTKKEENCLEEQIESKISYKDIAKMLGKSVASVSYKANKLGLKSKLSKFSRTTEEYKKLLPNDLCILEDYVTDKVKIMHKHVCGYEWKTMPTNIIQGKGCPKCASTGFNVDEKAYLYLIYFPSIDLYKVGISNNAIKRIKSFNITSEVILILYFNKGYDAKETEKKWLFNMKKYMCNTGLLVSGNTETFKY